MNPYNNSWQSRVNTIEGKYYKLTIKSDLEKLEKIDINLIEKFLRKKKLENINGKKND